MLFFFYFPPTVKKDLVHFFLLSEKTWVKDLSNLILIEVAVTIQHPQSHSPWALFLS